MKLLYITNISNGVSSFSVAAVQAANNLGIEFHLAGNFEGTSKEKLKKDEQQYGVKIHQIDLSRSPYSRRNIAAFKQLVEIIKNEKIDVIHCNTPVGGILGRLAGKKCKVKKVIYQAHGFHFYSGAPKKNWLIYYPVEKWLTRYTDAIITINQEDYKRAQGFRLKGNGKIYYVPGVGIDLKQFILHDNVREAKRKELNLPDGAVMLLSVGELNNNKNNKIILEAMGNIDASRVHYYLCGVGPLQNQLQEMAAEFHLEENVHFLGYRNDIKELLKACDIFVMPSHREGLSRSLMEAMAAGAPCVVSNIRGNTDLIEDTKGGILCRNIYDYVNAIEYFVNDSTRRIVAGEFNLCKIESFSMETVIDKLQRIYNAEFRW